MKPDFELVLRHGTDLAFHPLVMRAPRPYSDSHHRLETLTRGMRHLRLRGKSVREKEHLESLRRLVEESRDLIFETDAEGRLTYVNGAIGRLLGFQPRELLGRHFCDLVRTDHRDRALEHYSSQQRDGAISTYFEFPCTSKEGRELWLGQYVTMIIRAGKLAGFQAIARDMTDLRNVKQAHLAVEERFLAFMNNTPAINFIKDADGTLVFVNEPFARYFERTAESLIGSNQTEVFNDDVVAAVKATDEAVTVSRQSVRVVESFPSPQGSIHHWLIYKFPVPGPVGSVQVGAVGIDITDRVELEVDLADARDAALASVRLKAEFLANMSHEIRTPMNGVIGMLGVLLDTELGEDQRDLAETARSSAESLLTIINDILDFSKIEAGKLTFEMVDFDVRQVVESALDLIAGAARKKGLELGCVIDANVPPRVRGDAGRVRQVLINLVGNGVKFTEEGGVVVRVTRKSLDDEPVVLGFNVTDTGIGIADKAKKKLFQPFVQADSSTTRRFGGTGLGLVISKHLAELMNGAIGVESTQGFGSTFWFTAEFDDAEKSEPVAPAVKKPRVLLVDDSPTAIHVISAQLQACGVEAVSAGDAMAALRSVQSATLSGAPFDLVISDRRMEGVDGLALARLLRSQPQFSATRFGIISSTSPSETPAVLAENGVSFWLTKPVKQQQLESVVFGRPETFARPVVAPPPAAGVPLARGRVLVVEDNTVNQRVALRQIQKLGYSVDAVGNGYEALEAIERVAYDVILMDWHMPEMDGIEATIEIRRREKGERRIPIIALTASALPEDRAKCIEAGMDDFVTKPVREGDLEIALRRWMPQRPGEPAPAVLDLSALNELADGDDGFVRDLLQTFVEQGENLMRDASAAAAKGEVAGFMAAGHTLAGSARNVGALPLADLCTMTEVALRNGDSSSLPERLQAINTAFSAVRQEIASKKSVAA